MMAQTPGYFIGICEPFQKMRQVALRLSRGGLCHIGIGERPLVGDSGAGTYSIGGDAGWL
jgi:hypothetical protein